MFEFKNI